jgi:hypothetical protein
MIRFDGSNQPFVDFETRGGDLLRLTCVSVGGYRSEPHIRVQIQDTQKRLRQGPEIPLSLVGSVLEGIWELLAASTVRTGG